MSMRRLVVLPILVALAACRDSTAPGDPVAITVRAVTAAPGDTSHIRAVSLANDTITIVGRIGTPDPCHSISAYRVVSGSQIAFTVVATSSGGGCVTSLGLFEYTLKSRSSSCPAIVVTHHYVGSNWPDQRVFDQAWFCALASPPAGR